MFLKRVCVVVATGVVVMGCENKAPEKPQGDASSSASSLVAPEGADMATAGEPAVAEELPDHVKESRKFGHIPISGPTTREAVLEKFGTWSAKMQEASGDSATGEALAKVAPGATVTMFFGTWCSDCYLTLPTIWKTFDLAGPSLPFEVKYVALDEQFRAEGVDLATHDIRNIPTIVVSREGKEVGRFIEKSDRTASEELLSLLDGSKSGVISTNAKIRGIYNLDAPK